MKTTLTALIAFLFICTTSGYAEKVKGNGNIISKEIQISDYTELNIRVKINYNNNSSLFKKKNTKARHLIICRNQAVPTCKLQ